MMSRQGGRSTFAKRGREHMRVIRTKGRAGRARSLGYKGGSRRMALVRLLQARRIQDRGPDPSPAIEWAERAMEAFDPSTPEVPYWTDRLGRWTARGSP